MIGVWRFLGDTSLLDQAMTGTYNPTLVGLSVIVASLGAYTALAVVDRIRSASVNWIKTFWLFCGATAFGCGVWAMHFVGMLAFNLPVPISYEVSLTMISILPAVFGSGIALWVMSQKKIRWWRLQTGALLMAIGIGTMHYLGMEAIRLNARMQYDVTLFALSIVAAHVMASLALYIKFLFENRRMDQGLLGRSGSSLAMGIAISSMHYIAMAAAQFFPQTNGNSQSMILPPMEIGIFVVIISFLIIGFAIIGARVDKRFAEASHSARESEDFAMLLLESAGEGICGIDDRGHITFANPAAAEMLGFEAKKLIGTPFARLIAKDPGRIFPRQDSPLDAGIESKQRIYSERSQLIRENGNEFAVEFTLTRVEKQGKPVGSVITFRDISERLQAENDLRESEEKFRQIAEQSQDALCLTSADGLKVLYISPAYEKIWGRTCESLYSSPASWLDSIHPDDRPRVQSAFRTKAVQGQEYTEEFRIIRPDGSHCWLLDHCFPIRDSEGKLKHIAWFAQDINHRKQMETELRLAQKLEAVGQLAAGVAHEINTPIQYVGDNIDFLGEAFSQIALLGEYLNRHPHHEAAKNPGDEAYEQLRTILEETEFNYWIEEGPKAIAESQQGIRQITKIVQAMKAFSHPGGENIEESDVNAIIKNSVAVSRGEWKYCAKMELDLDETIPKVPCYSQAIGQVILNLIVNAAHAIREVVQEKTGEMGTITLSSKLQGDSIQIGVADTGSGIPEHLQHKIFDPFFTTKEVGIGTGQGLALARSTIVDGHGGTLQVEPNEGRGSKFLIGLKTVNPDFDKHEHAA